MEAELNYTFTEEEYKNLLSNTTYETASPLIHKKPSSTVNAFKTLLVDLGLSQPTQIELVVKSFPPASGSATSASVYQLVVANFAYGAQDRFAWDAAANQARTNNSAITNPTEMAQAIKDNLKEMKENKKLSLTDEVFGQVIFDAVVGMGLTTFQGKVDMILAGYAAAREVGTSAETLSTSVREAAERLGQSTDESLKILAEIKHDSRRRPGQKGIIAFFSLSLVAFVVMAVYVLYIRLKARGVQNNTPRYRKNVILMLLSAASALIASSIIFSRGTRMYTDDFAADHWFSYLFLMASGAFFIVSFRGSDTYKDGTDLVARARRKANRDGQPQGTTQ